MKEMDDASVVEVGSHVHHPRSLSLVIEQRLEPQPYMDECEQQLLHELEATVNSLHTMSPPSSVSSANIDSTVPTPQTPQPPPQPISPNGPLEALKG
jgi:hypothetical protein